MSETLCFLMHLVFETLTWQQSGLVVVLAVLRLKKSPHSNCCPVSCKSDLAAIGPDPGSVFPASPYLA